LTDFALRKGQTPDPARRRGISSCTTTELSIDIPLALIGETNDLFFDVRLLGLDTIGVADRVTLE